MKESFEYKSRFTGEHCICVITGVREKSNNRKTGAMAQVWFLLRDTPPHEAVKSCKDRGVCGTCPLKGGRGCYVRTEQAPLAIWKKWHAGGYRDDLPATIPAVRFGAYGDPASLPARLWEHLVSSLMPRRWTGYTHGWRKAPWLRPWCMASAEKPEDAIEAHLKRWSVFQTVPTTVDVTRTVPERAWCPAAVRGIHCDQCLRCSGSHNSGRQEWVQIPAHGARKSMVHA